MPPSTAADARAGREKSRAGRPALLGPWSGGLAAACSAAVLLWLIDDTADNHPVAERTADLVAGVRFRGFLEADAGIAAFAAAAAGDGPLPDAVLMDYYLGDTRGDRVTRRLRELEPRAARPTIIGYSSVASGSAAILAAGGDLVLRKHADGEGINPSLLAWLRARAG